MTQPLFIPSDSIPVIYFRVYGQSMAIWQTCFRRVLLLFDGEEIAVEE